MSQSRRRPLVAVDARMVEASGIGTYLRNVLRRLVAGGPEWRLALLGDPGELARYEWASAPGVEVVPHHAPLYGLRRRNVKYIKAPRPEFYDLRDDPGELNNLYGAARPEICSRCGIRSLCCWIRPSTIAASSSSTERGVWMPSIGASHSRW